MSKNLVLFGGWLRGERSYQRFVKISPVDCNINVLSYETMMPRGRSDEFAQNVTQFLKKNNLSKVSIMGHSLGGSLALKFAYHYPDKVEHLYLVDSEGIYGHETLPQLIRNFIRSNLNRQGSRDMKNISDLLKVFKKPILHFKLAHFAHYVDLQKEANSLKVPTTILWGEKDHLTPLWQGQRLHELIKGSKLIVLKDMDHDWILHSPELFWQNVTE